MSRPYLNLINAYYTDPILSLDIEYLRLRGGGTFSISGILPTDIIISDDASHSGGIKTFTINVGELPSGEYTGRIHFSKLNSGDEFSFVVPITTTTTTTTLAPSTTTTTTTIPETTTTSTTTTTTTLASSTTTTTTTIS